MENNKKKIKKLLSFKQDPSLATFNAISDLEERIEDHKEAVAEHGKSVERLIGLGGIPGPSGRDGKDGKDGPVGPQGPKGDPGTAGRDGRDGIDGMDGSDGVDGKAGRDGKDGSPDSPAEIVSKLESLSGNLRLDAKAIRNLPQFTREIVRDTGFRAGAMETPIKAGTGISVVKDSSGAWVISSEGGGGTVTGADNGLNLNGTDVYLGGALLQNTSVDTTGFDFDISRTLSSGVPISTVFSSDLPVIGALFGATLEGIETVYNDPAGYYGVDATYVDPTPGVSLPGRLIGIVDTNTGNQSFTIMNEQGGIPVWNAISQSGAGDQALVSLKYNDKAELEFGNMGTGLKANFTAEAAQTNMLFQNSVSSWSLSNGASGLVWKNGTRKYLSITPTLVQIADFEGHQAGAYMLIAQGSNPAIALMPGSSGARIDQDGTAETVSVGATGGTQELLLKTDFPNRQIYLKSLSADGSTINEMTFNSNSGFLHTQVLTPGSLVDGSLYYDTTGAYMDFTDIGGTGSSQAKVSDSQFTYKLNGKKYINAFPGGNSYEFGDIEDNNRGTKIQIEDSNYRMRFTGNISEASVLSVGYGSTHNYAGDPTFTGNTRIIVTGGTGATTILLPVSTTAEVGTRIGIKDLDCIASTSNITIDAGTGNTVNLASAAQTQTMTVDGTSWTLVKVTATEWSVE